MKLGWICLGVVFCAVAVLAADSVAVVSDSLTTTVDTLVKHVSNVVDAAKNFNADTKFVSFWLVVSAVITFLISLMKFKPVAKLLDCPKMKAVKPYLSMILGLIGGLATGIVTGQPWIVDVIAGLSSGLGAIGIHETLKSVKGKNA